MCKVLNIVTFSFILFQSYLAIAYDIDDYDVAFVIEDSNNNNSYNIIKIKENDNPPLTIEYCSNNCNRKINTLFDYDKKETFFKDPLVLSFKLKYDQYEFIFRSKLALVACKRRLSRNITYNDGRYDGSLSLDCHKSRPRTYSLVQRNANNQSYPVVNLYGNNKNIKVDDLRRIATIHYKRASGEQNTEKYFSQEKAWLLLEESKSYCNYHKEWYKGGYCVAWCYTKQGDDNPADYALNINDIDQCVFDEKTGKKQIYLHPSTQVCDLKEKPISHYRNGRDTNLQYFRSIQKLIYQNSKYCPNSFKSKKKADPVYQEIDKGISLTPIYIQNEKEIFYRHKKTFVYLELILEPNDPIDNQNDTIDLLNSYQSIKFIPLNRRYNGVYDYYIRSLDDRNTLHPERVFKDIKDMNRRDTSHHYVYITNNLSSKHINELTKKNMIRLSIDNTITFISIGKGKGGQKAVDRLRKNKKLRNKNINLFHLDISDPHSKDKIHMIINEAINPNLAKKYADDTYNYK